MVIFATCTVLSTRHLDHFLVHLLRAGHPLLLVQDSVLDLHTLTALRNLPGQVKLLLVLLRTEKMCVVTYCEGEDC
ncbi:hypothetical protein Hanom_Chr07g00594481 [Helianthus anomalus]